MGMSLVFLKKYTIDNYKNINFLGLISWYNLLPIYSNSDILFLQINKNYETAIPSKIFEYVMTGRPIIACIPNGAARDIMYVFRCLYM